MRKEEVREVTCIICPIGCSAKVTIQDGRVVKIENLECKRGEEYVRNEVTAPVRDFFTTVGIENARVPMLPVRSTAPVPKEKLAECASELARVTVEPPIKMGDVIIKNILNLGIDIVATRDLDRHPPVRSEG